MNGPCRAAKLFRGLRDAPKGEELLRKAANKATLVILLVLRCRECLSSIAYQLPDKLPSMNCLIRGTVLLLLAQQLLMASAYPFSAPRFARPARAVAGARNLRTRALLQDFGGVSSLSAWRLEPKFYASPW